MSSMDEEAGVSESYSDDVEDQSQAGDERKSQSYGSDHDQEAEAADECEEAEEELVDDLPSSGSASEHSSQEDNAMDAAGDEQEEGFYEEEVVDDEDQQSERADPPTTASHALVEQAPASAHTQAEAEEDDSYSDDAEQDASPSTQDAAAEQMPVQAATAKYLQMLKSGQLKLPKLDKKEGAVLKPSRPSSSQYAHLSIREMVSASVASNIYARSPKVLTPGPGAYEPAKDRFGKHNSCSTSFTPQQMPTNRYSFGMARQRPPHVCITSKVVSPGPTYLPHKDVSTLGHVPQLSFPRQEVGTRFMLSASMPANCPHWNPGPGHYKAHTVYKGGVVDPNDAPSYGFSKGSKVHETVARLTPAALLYESKENAEVGPASYYPDPSVTKPSVVRYSLAEKAPSYFDAYLDPAQQISPGPVYPASHIDGRGKKAWGDEPRPTFGRSKKEWVPEVNYSATCFISKVHAHHSNQTLHSPGPVYFPELPQHHQTPLFASGPADRFYDRFEPGRVV